MRKPASCICENKDADQLRGNREADQRLCFRYTDSTIRLLAKSKISRLWASSVALQPGLCRTWSETPKTGFLRTRLIYFYAVRFLCLSSFHGKIRYRICRSLDHCNQCRVGNASLTYLTPRVILYGLVWPSNLACRFPAITSRALNFVSPSLLLPRR